MTPLGPPTLHVPPTYRRPRFWPWVVLVLVLLGVGAAELVHRRAAAPPPPSAGLTGPRSTQALPPSTVGPASVPPGRAGGPEPRKAGIAGRVLGPDARPAPGVTVVVTTTGAETRSDGVGSFQLEVEDGRTVRLQAHHSDLGFASAELRAPAVGLEMRLQARAGLEVRVLAEGRPLPEAAISVQQQGGEGALFHADRATDTTGLLRFVGLPAGTLSVEALLPMTGARSSLVVEAREGEVTPVTLLLPVVGVVRGTVVTRAGAPVPGAFVGVEEAEGLPAQTSTDGSFELKGLPTGRDFRLTARTPELSLDGPVTARAGQSGVRLVVRERALYRGRVVGPSGTPVAGFSIDGRGFQAPDGRFQAPLETRDGQVELRVSASGMLTRTVRAGATVSELGDIALQPGPQIEGTVRLASGAPVQGALVTAGADSTRSGPGGVFALPIAEPPAGAAPLYVHAAEGELSGSAEVPIGTPADIILAGEASVRVRVFGADGTPARGRTVQLAGIRTYAWTTDADGATGGKALAGDYRVSTDAQPGRVWFVRLPASELVLGAPAGSATLEVSLDAPVEALWIEKG
ncbi:MAG TPA: hypothetical protein VLQ79_12275, partial [Myxococcaceae bacterium]|nr:hypothetical protein [Myxococcaceae bacterium]